MSKFDQVFINGNVFTSDSANPCADAFAVKDGRIAWVGSANSVDLSGEVCVDLQGKRVLPGFIDSHMHPIMLAENSRKITCLPPVVNSIEEMVGAIKKMRVQQGPDQWVMGWGYDEGKLAEGRTPSRHDLDRGAADVPVCILRSCGHIRCVNSRALQLAGIDRNTPNPQGGEIVRDEAGEPTGVLRENARFLLKDVLPVDTEENTIDNLLNLGDILLSQGITTIADMGGLNAVDYYPVYWKARERGFRQRVSMFYMWDNFRDQKDFTIEPERMDHDAPIRAAGLKLISDGGISGRTAWCDRPYLGGNGDEYGISTCSKEEILEAIDFCKKHNAQLSIHAMGQRAIDLAVDTVSAEAPWLKDDSGADTPYARIEHASMPTKQALEKAAKAGIAFVTQPIFLYCEIERYLENMGTEWLQSTFPVNDILDAGIRLSFSTDAPATPWAAASDPVYCLKAAVTRKAYDGTDCGQKHRVDIETAIRLYTEACAPIMGFKNLGKIAPGCHADFIVLDRDILNIPAEEIDQVKVEQTYIEGEKVYQRQPDGPAS